jgi:hypothetical protein
VRCTVTLGRSATKLIATDVDTLGLPSMSPLEHESSRQLTPRSVTRMEQELDSAEGLGKEEDLKLAQRLALLGRPDGRLFFVIPAGK